MIYSDFVKNRHFIYFGYRKVELSNLLFAVFTFGFVVGISLFGFLGDETKAQIKVLVEGYTKNIYDRGVISNFIYYYFGYSLFILVVFFVGFCPIGQIFTFFVPFIYSIGLGVYSSYIYYNYYFKGVIFCLICLAPCEIIYSFSLILASQTSILYSNEIFKRLFPKKYTTEIFRRSFKLYLIRFLFLFLFLFIAIFLNILLRYIFTRIIF